MSMQYRELGTSGIQVSAIGLGGWAFGGDVWGDVDDDESIATIHAALDDGINLIDTAESYGEGHSEEVIGKALQGRREQAIVATKVSPHHLDREGIRAALEGSLRRLRMEFVDLYQVHWPNRKFPIEETMEALAELVEEGKIRAIGVSNFSLRQLEAALQVATVHALQPPYSLIWRMAERELIPFCRTHGIGVLAYSPLAQGLLTGKFTLENRPHGADIRRKNRLFKKEETYRIACDVAQELEALARRHGMTAAQMAINWVICQPGITSALVGAKRPAQVRENAAAADFQLSPEVLEEIRRLGDRVVATLDTNPHMWTG
jgi:aryl-alcohol dehydrogenase-like predicted oxidoreductase